MLSLLERELLSQIALEATLRTCNYCWATLWSQHAGFWCIGNRLGAIRNQGGIYIWIHHLRFIMLINIFVQKYDLYKLQCPDLNPTICWIFLNFLEFWWIRGFWETRDGPTDGRTKPFIELLFATTNMHDAKRILGCEWLKNKHVKGFDLKRGC